MYKKILQLLGIVMLTSNFVNAQQGGPDCSSAATICNSSSISINPSGIGFDDFSLPGNNAGCLSSDEQASTWFYFEFNVNTPPNSPFTFTINPTVPVDYDFALFGPNVPDCDNLGSPLRCSYAALAGPTGLSTAANDLSEGAGGDRFVMEIFVNAGDGFFLLVDNFSQSNTSASISFGEAGAPFLDCLATPFCGLMADASATMQICQDSGPFNLNSNVTGETGGVTYNWTGAGGATAYLDDPTSPFPTVTPPSGFTGTLTYNLTVMDDACDMVTPDISIEVVPLPTIDIPDPGLICSANDPIVLTGNPGGGSGTWGGVAGPNGEIDPSLLGPGPHMVTYEYTDANGCTNDGFTNITITESPTAEIVGDLEICQREIDNVTAILDGFGVGGSPNYTYQWSTPQGIDNNQTVFVLEPGNYDLTVTDAIGCTAEAPGVVVDILPDPMITIFDPGVICGTATSQEIIVGTFENGVGQWDTSTGVINAAGFIDPSALGVGFHEVTYSFTSDVTGCDNTETITIEVSPPPTATPSTGGPYCNGEDIELFGNASVNGATYSWTGPDGFTSNQQNPPTANGPGSYFLTVSIGGCESFPVELTIALDASPIAMASNNGSACAGSSVTLQGGVNVAGTNTTYAWTGPDGYTSNQQNPTDAMIPGTYTLVVTVDGCPSDPVTTEVTIIDAPIATAGNNGPACSGFVVSLEGNVNVGGTTVEYSWTGPGGYTSNQQNPGDATMSGSYELIVTVDGCPSDPVTTNVTITAPPMATASNTGSVCAGGAVTLQGSVDLIGTVTTYAWTGPGGYTSNDQNPTDAMMSGTYQLIVTVDGCPSNFATTMVTILDIPVATASNNGPSCSGTSVTLEGGVNLSGTTTYSWTGPGGYTSNDQNPTDAMMSGTYELIVTVDGCPSDPVPTNVTIADAPVATASNNGPACTGGSVTLEGTVDVSGTMIEYSWTGPGGYTSNQQNPTDAMETGGYQLIVTVDGCPSDPEITIVTIEDAPIAIAANNGPVCEGSMVTLEGDVDITGMVTEYSWTGPGGYTSNQQYPTDAIMDGTYELIVTVDGCPSLPVTTDLTIRDTPIATASNNGPACVGNNITLEGSINLSDPATYSWTGPGGYTSDDQNPTDATMSGIYELIVVVDGCPSELVITEVTIVDAPIATASNNGPACAGSSVSLEGDVNVSGTTIEYAWTGPGGYTSDDQNPTDATESGTYELIVTVDGCVSAAAPTMVTINASPAATATNSGVACSGSSVTLQGSVDITGTTIDYAWTGPNGYTSDEQNPTDAMMDGTYELIVTVDGCASAAVPTTVTIADEPVATASNNGPACAGSSVSLEGDVDVSGTTIDYAWTGPNGYTSSDQNPTDATESGTYELIVTVDGCVSAAVPTTVTIADEPVATASNDGPVCSGSMISLEGDVDVSGTTIEYSWTGPGGYTSDEQDPTDVMMSGDYILVVTVDGCESSAVQTTVTINPTPDAVPSNSGPFCADEVIALMGSTTTSGTNISYEWAGPNGYNSTDQNPTDISLAGDYSLVVTIDGCISPAEMTTIEITALPIAQPATGGNPCTAADIELVGGSDTPGVSYSWTGPDGFTSSDQNPPMANGPGIYTLIVTNGTCISLPVDIDINPGTAPVATASTAGPYCEGDLISLTGSVNATGTNIVYEWTGPNGYSSMDQNPTGITEAGIYELNVTVDGCVADADDVEILITSLPTAIPSTGGPYCNALDIELFGDASVATATYSWVGPNGFVSSSQNPTTASEGGIYTLTVFENGCSSASEEVTVILNETPTAEPSNTGPYCEGDMIMLSGSTATVGTATEYAWTGPNGYISTDQNPTNATEAGDYNLVVTVDGCVSDVEGTTIVVNDLPIAQPATGGSPCTSTSIELLGGSNVEGMGETYSWTGPNGFVSNEQNPTMNGGEGTYELVVTLNGCSSLPVELVVDPGAEPIATASNDGPYCEGDMIDLTGSVNAVGMVVAYSWTGPNGYSSTDQNPTDATASGDYILVATVDGCVSQQGITSVVVNDLPIAQPATGGSPCTSTSIELLGGSNVEGMGETYSWTGPNGFVSNEQNPTMNGGEGTYELVVTLNGCSSIPVELIVDPGAEPVATASNDGPYCSGDIIDLTGSVNATGMVVEYAWSGPNGYFSSEQNPTDATESGDYSLIVTVDGCVSNMAGTSLVINEVPMAQATTGGSPCLASTIELLGSSSITGIGETYSWTGPNGFVSDEQNPSMNGGAGTYELVVTLNGCSSAPSEIVVAPNAVPVATATNSGPFCVGDMIDLSGEVDVAGTVIDYAWTGPNGYISTAQNPTDVTESGDYTLVATVDGCVSDVGTTTIVINDLPIAQPATGGSPCTSTTIELLGNSNVTGMGETYSWTGPNGFTSDEQNPATNGGEGTYELVVTLNGCSSEPVALIVDPGAAPIATATNPGPFCADEIIDLTGSVNATGMVVEYAWSGPNGYFSSEQNPSDATESGDYTLVATVDGCVSDPGTTTVEINDLPIAQPSTGGSPCTSTTIELLGSSNVLGMGELYSWTGPNGFVSNEQNPTMNGGEGTYFLTVILNGCSSEPAQLIVAPGAEPVATASNDGPFCVGDIIDLTGSVNATGTVVTYEWNGPNGYFSSEQNPSDATDSGVYNLVVTVDGCVSNMALTNVDINTTPEAELTPNAIVLCNTSAEGSTLDFGPLVVSGDQGGSWIEQTSSGASGVFPNLDFDGVAAGVYDFVYTTNSAIAPCTDQSYSISITIEECACPGVNLNTPAPLCNVDGMLDLNSLVNSGPDGFWTIVNTPGGANPATLTNTMLDASNADQGTYTLQYTLIDAVPVDCDTEFTIDLEVSSATTAGVANAPLDFCSDESNMVDLFGELTGADAGGTWSILQGDGSGFDASSGSFVMTGQPSDTYIFQYELLANGACPGDVETVTVNINALPTAEAGEGTTLICGMNDFELTGSGTTGNGIVVTWTGPGMIVNGDSYTPTINSEGIYTLTVENTLTGCISTDEVEIFQSADIPVVNVSTANPLTCDSISVVLFSNTDLITSVDYSWTGPNGFVSTEQYPTVNAEGDYFVTIFNPLNNCTSSPAMVSVVDNSESPNIDLIVPLEPLDCDTDALLIDASGSQGNGVLSFTFTNIDGEVISTSSTFEISTSGTYELLVLNTTTGCTAEESFTIEQDITEPIPSIGTPGVIDCDNPSVIVTGTSQSSGNNPLYNWYDENGNLLTSDNDNLTATSAGIYTLEVINGENQCSATTEVTVSSNVSFPLANIENPEMIDCTVTEVTLSGEGSATGTNIAYEWQDGLGEIIGTDLTVAVNNVGDYELVVTNTENGCTTVEGVEVERNGDEIETALIITEPSDCFESDNGLIIISEVEGGTGPFMYSIGDEVLSSQNASFNLSPGVYEIQVSDALGCEWETEVTVTEPAPLSLTIDLNLEADASLFYGDSLILNATTFVADNQIDTLIWNQPNLIRCEDEDCFEGVVHNLFDPTSFSATLIDTAGCTVTASVAVGVEKVREIYIPNSFSPNGDGLNDIFFINAGRGVSRINSFRVYNRWGEVVYSNINFQPNAPVEGWDGIFRGKEVNPAVFVYVAEILFIDGSEEMYSGDVTVVK